MSTQEVATFEGLPVPKAKVEQAQAEIDFNNPTLTLSYGAKTMDEISKFTDSLLGSVMVKDSGPVGQGLSDLMLRLKDVDLDQISNSNKGFWESLPVIGRLFNSLEKTMAQFNTVLEQVEGITKKLEDAMYGLLKDIKVLDQLYNHNKNFYEELTAYIEAGEDKLNDARNTELPRLEAIAKETNDNLAAQNVRDFADKLNRFERRLHDLKLSRTITLQTAPQIRMIQSNDQNLAEKIQTSILATIPIWKNQMVLALSIHGQRQAAHLQKEVADTTNEMLRKNAAMLQSSTVETAREVERSIVDLETLKDVQQRLISTIEETMHIVQQGRQQRHNAEKELQHMEADLRDKLTALAKQKVQDEITSAHGLGQALSRRQD
ncbi:MAG: toxic anion resistance protein [Desulfovibrionaceae bacterium]|nr:toxic anion resistance protein [Desulfovibrionaceae bacterium]